uniref:Meckel syndrome type 1 protein n=1 Tax=Panagrolaimus sp. JU765 TaxID=591449 RepID=A0AC34PV61_9BILA
MSSFPSSNYHISGGIKHLRLSVKLEYIGAVFGNARLDKTGASLEASGDDSFSVEPRKTEETVVISWQQKIPHPIRDTLPNDENTGTQTTKSRIFTYINADIEKQRFEKAKATGEVSVGVRQRKVRPMSAANAKEPITVLNKKQKKAHRNVPFNQQSMEIMAYFGPFNKNSTENVEIDEKLLCRIIARNDQSVIFQPDLGTRRVETRYGLYDVTVAIFEDPHFDTIPGYNIEWEDNVKDDSDSALFELPDPRKIWIQYLITIEEGVNFLHDGLSVEYMIELPSHIKAARGYEEMMSGQTQVCFTKSQNYNDVAKFSFPIEIVLEFSSTTIFNQNLWPRLLCKVVSEDYWQRNYVDGYGQIPLPTKAGRHALEVYCWRPINPRNYLFQMKDYFLGQAVDLQSINRLGISGNCIGKMLSNVSIDCESGGKLRFTVDCLKQSRQYISKEVLRSLQYGSLLNRIGLNSSLHWRIMKILTEFEDARQQLLRLRSRKML